MNATIFSHNCIIGTAELHVNNDNVNCLSGEFIPNENYFKNIQKKVWQLCVSGKPQYEKWHSLRFNVKINNGYFLFPSGRSTISDLFETPKKPKMIHLEGIDPDVLKLRPDNLPHPWSLLHIDQKTSFEDELRRVIAPTKSILNFLSSKDQHPLVGAQVSAVAKFGLDGDVLFEVIKKGEVSQLAVVPLTWSSNRTEQSNYLPKATFYRDFNDFVGKRIKPDRIESNG